VRIADLAHWDVTRGREVVERSPYDLLVGASSADIRARATVFVRGERIPPRDLSRRTPADAFDDYSGVSLVDRTKARGTAVESEATGAWVQYADAALRRARTLRARVSGAGRIEVRLASPDGRLLGVATAPGTGDRYSYVTVRAPLAGARGRHAVYTWCSAPACGSRASRCARRGPAGRRGRR
jgi:beta-glucosidase